MNENERAMYSGLAMCRNTEVTQRWSRSQFFFLIHSAALSFVTTLDQPEFGPLLINSLAGVFLGFFWLAVNMRTNQWIVYWQSRLEAFELLEPTPAEIPIFSGLAYQRVAGRLITFHRIIATLAGFFILIWVDIIVQAFLL